ncbi:hypothetical protein DCAR_0311683 [Daucus carota subsp. sativus]|uniref:Uncharacterized protein n=1 Tax=Daucus carota subsp. sativus TaxID=79200 RepID=A0A166AMW3_DAUCS|nr:hypothetical protein DCAR_0311683 [Daucus carota subsp. sativus]
MLLKAYAGKKLMKKRVTRHQALQLRYPHLSYLILLLDISEKSIKNNKLGICYEYGRRPGKEAVSDCVGDDTIKQYILRNVQKPVFKVIEPDFVEEGLLIK